MHSLSRATLAAAALVVSLTGLAAAQTTALGKQLSRVTFGIDGAGEFNSTASGVIIPTGASDCNSTTVGGPCTTVMTQYGSNTVGAGATIRYVAKPYIGLEFNYGWARYTQNFSPAPDGSSLFQVQNTANEYTLGYVINPPHPLFGFQPFLAVGAGSTEFKPTGGGGEGEPKQARATYYYNVGIEKQFGETPFGMRASFRELFFLYPDFGQNYLTIKQRGTTYQPTIGFYARF
jgi:hypothetical protein